MTLAAILRLDQANRLRCFGGAPLRFRAWVTNLGEGLGGTCEPFEPGWLFECAKGTAARIQARPDSPKTLEVRLHPPLAGDALLPYDRWVSVTGHFDDPVALSCRSPLKPTDPGYEPPPTVVLGCREQFVITSIKAAKAP